MAVVVEAVLVDDVVEVVTDVVVLIVAGGVVDVVSVVTERSVVTVVEVVGMIVTGVPETVVTCALEVVGVPEMVVTIGTKVVGVPETVVTMMGTVGEGFSPVRERVAVEQLASPLYGHWVAHVPVWGIARADTRRESRKKTVCMLLIVDEAREDGRGFSTLACFSSIHSSRFYRAD